MIPLLFAALGWAGTPGTEFVIVLDNSCSMVEPHTRGSDPTMHPAADPQRRAVLGALLVAGLAEDSDDRLTVLGFPAHEGDPLFESTDEAQIRDLPISTGTYFREPLQRAHQILSGSKRDDRMLLFLSDGDPNDLNDPAEGRALLGLDEPEVPYDTLILGLFPGDNERAESFLRPLAMAPEDYVRVQDGADLVDEFTHAYARVLGSKPISGQLQSGRPVRFEVGKYVEEVLIVLTSLAPAQGFAPKLLRGKRELAPKTRGDNGCSKGTRRNPDLCKAPRIQYATWRHTHDPNRVSTWTLSADGAASAFGVILRYDLHAKARIPKTAETHKPVQIRARLMWHGKPFVDEDFFSEDDFKAEALVDGKSIPLTYVGDGLFETTWTPDKIGRNDVVVRFANTWMEKRDRVRVRVAPDKPLDLSAEVDALDFGHWSGERRATERCIELQVEANRRVPANALSYSFEKVPKHLSLSVEPNGKRLRACARAKGCCSAIDASGASLVVAATANGESATVRIPVRATVAKTGFLACWWPWLLGATLLLVVLWFLHGWIRPNDFDEGLTVQVAGSERQLNRTAELVLREQPGGRRGFYRNARIALTGSGDFVRNPKSAAVWIEAVGSDETRIHTRATLEVQDRRTKKWVLITEEEAEDGVRSQVLYKVGDILFRFR